MGQWVGRDLNVVAVRSKMPFLHGRIRCFKRKVMGSDCVGARVSMILLITSTLIIGAITVFVFCNEGGLFKGVAGQILHGLLSIICFALVGLAFSCFGWKVGVIDLALLFITSNVGLTFYTYARKRSSL
jgi:hypothetical protein